MPRRRLFGNSFIIGRGFGGRRFRDYDYGWNNGWYGGDDWWWRRRRHHRHHHHSSSS